MKLKILSWNVQGLNNYDQKRRVRNSLKKWKGDDVCLPETKLEVINRAMVRSVWGSPFVDWAVLEAEGFGGERPCPHPCPD